MPDARRVDAGALRRQRDGGADIAEFLAEPSIDGALVGGASLKPDEMAAIRRAGTAGDRGARGPVAATAAGPYAS